MFSYKVKRVNNRSANIKGYLGGFHGLNGDADVDEDEDEIDNDSDSPSKEPGVNTCPFPNSQRDVSVLVEIPEELDIARIRSHCEDGASRFTYPTSTRNKKSKHRIRPSDNSISNSAAVVEIGNNLMDLDNYMLSAFHMSDDASVYTKATADTGFSSSNSSTSVSSTRKRHRGAFRNRIKSHRDYGNSQRRGIFNRNKKAHNWLDSMKESSMNIYEDGGEGWTPSSGWRKTDEKSGWDMTPDRQWNDRDPVFDSVKRERLEI